MQRELQATYPLLRIGLLGINEPNQEPGNATATNGRDIPWLQDSDTDGNGRGDASMDLWNMSFRDVFILDGGNRLVGRYNLNQHDLANSVNYETLKKMVIDVAMSEQRPWQNPTNPRDVNDDGRVVPLDVLVIINELNLFGARPLPPPTGSNSPPPFWDTNGDGNLTPADALLVINFLNSPGGGFQAEGEAVAMEVTAVDGKLGLEGLRIGDDRQVAETRDEHPWQTDCAKDRQRNNCRVFFPLTLPSPTEGEGTSDRYFFADPNGPSWDGAEIMQVSAFDDAARIAATDWILSDASFAGRRTAAEPAPADEWFELLSL